MSMYPRVEIVYGFEINVDDITRSQWLDMLDPKCYPEDWWDGIQWPSSPCKGYLHHSVGEGLDRELLFLGSVLAVEHMDRDCETGVETLEAGKSAEELLAFARKHGIFVPDTEPKIFKIVSWW